MVQNYWKVLKINFLDFWSFPKTIKKLCQRRPHKSCFWIQMATWASQVGLILWFWKLWCDAKESWFLDALPMYQKIEQIEPWSAKGSKKRHRVFDNATFRGGRGPQDELKVGPCDHWRDPDTPLGRRSGEYIYIYIYIYKQIYIYAFTSFVFKIKFV